MPFCSYSAGYSAPTILQRAYPLLSAFPITRGRRGAWSTQPPAAQTSCARPHSAAPAPPRWPHPIILPLCHIVMMGARSCHPSAPIREPRCGITAALGVPGPLVGRGSPRAACEGAPGANSLLGAALQLETPSPPASSTSFPLGHRQGPSANTSVIFNEEQGRGRSCLQPIWKVQLTKGRRET